MSKRTRKEQAPHMRTEAENALKKSDAKTLFLAGYNPKEIDAKLGLRENTTGRWVAYYRWVEEREKTLEQSSKNKLQILLEQQEETFEELKTIREKAFDPIFADELAPTKFSEATNAYLSTLELERKMKVEALQISFLVDVAKVIRDTVQDRDLLSKIAQGLQQVYEKYHSDSLSPNIKSEEIS